MKKIIFCLLVNFIFFTGCQRNEVLKTHGISYLEKREKLIVINQSNKNDAEIVIINTCGFIENAKEESINTILVQAERKEAGMIDKLYVTGCLSERYKPDLERDIPNVDQYFGTTDLPKLLKVLGADYKHELLGERLTTTPKHYAYLFYRYGKICLDGYFHSLKF